MNKNTLSNKSVFLIAAMLLSGMMLATSSVPTRAFAQVDTPDVEALLTQPSPDSTSEEDTSASEEDTSASEEDTSASEEDTSEAEVGVSDVIVDPRVQTAVEADMNVNVDTHVITDEDNCEDASDDVDQTNDQAANQQARSDGEVGDNGLFISPKLQTAEEVGLNFNIDQDVVLVEGCSPHDEVDQTNNQAANQGAFSDVEASGDSKIIDPAYQIVDTHALNFEKDKDVIRPVF
jgi:hypothetical protein